MLAIVFAFVAYVAWGTGDIFGAKITRIIGGYQTAFWFYIGLIPLYVIACLLFPKGLENINLNSIIICFVLALVAAASMISFYESLRLGVASLVITISSAFPALVVPLSIFFLKEKITIYQLLAILLILAGVIFANLNLKDLKEKNFKLKAGVGYALSAFVLWGIYWTLIKIPVTQIGWAWPNLIITIFDVIMMLAFFKVKQLKLDFPKAKEVSKFLVLNPAFLGSGTLALNFGMTLGGSSSILVPIASAYPTLLIPLSYMVFKDPVTRQEIIGIIITVMGIVLLSTLSV